MNCSAICVTRAVPTRACDQVEHHIERRNAAGAGHPIAIYHEEFFQKARVGKLFLERRHVLPVNRARIAR